MKKMAMLLAASCAIGMLTGCGIPEEEHLAIIAGMDTEHQAEVTKLNGTISDRDDVIKSQKAKAQQIRLEVASAEKSIKVLEKKNAETSKELATEKSKVATLGTQLRTSKSQTAAARDDAMEAENKYSTLEVDYQDLNSRFEMFQQNMNALNTPEPEMEEVMPMTDAEKASRLLEEMGAL